MSANPPAPVDRHSVNQNARLNAHFRIVSGLEAYRRGTPEVKSRTVCNLLSRISRAPVALVSTSGFSSLTGTALRFTLPP